MTSQTGRKDGLCDGTNQTPRPRTVIARGGHTEAICPVCHRPGGVTVKRSPKGYIILDARMKEHEAVS
jgi:hypothetical protein